MKKYFGFLAMAVLAVMAMFVFREQASPILALCVDWVEGFTGHVDGLAMAALPLAGIKELRAKRAQLANEARSIIDSAPNGVLDADADARWNTAMQEIDQLKAQIDREERMHDLEVSLEERSRVMSQNGDPAGDKQPGEYRQAFQKYLRDGIGALNNDELRTLQTGRVEMRAQSTTTTAGGYTVPDEAMRPIEDTLLQFGGMREVATVITTATGASLPMPTATDVAQKGEIIAENSAHNAQDITFGQITLDAYMYSSKIVLVSQQLLQDTSIDIEAFIGRKLGERIGRITNDHFTTGTGSSQPKGVVTCAGEGKVGATGQTTTVTYADIVDLFHAVDPAYRANARFMMHDSTLAALKKLVDSDGRPLWLSGIALREPDTLLGKPFTINQSMDAMAAGKKSILFGDMSKYIIREVKGVQVLRLVERYAEYLQVGFLGFARYDGDLLDAGTDPVKYYQNSAS